jgi:uncharacterized membrane protein
MEVAHWGVVARAVHVLAVVAWIGGVYFVTAVLLPALKQRPEADWLQEFEAIERRFAPQARILVLLVLLSGLYMLYRYDLWSLLADARAWWMHLMMFVWLVFALLLFVVEPVFHGAIARRAASDPRAALRRIHRMHLLLLLVSLAAVFAAVAGTHGLV